MHVDPSLRVWNVLHQGRFQSRTRWMRWLRQVLEHQRLEVGQHRRLHRASGLLAQFCRSKHARAAAKLRPDPARGRDVGARNVCTGGAIERVMAREEDPRDCSAVGVRCLEVGFEPVKLWFGSEGIWCIWLRRIC